MDPVEDRTCENCGRWIEPNEVLYRATLEIYADPSPPEIDAEESAADARARYEELLRQMEAMSDDEAQEASDQVHQRHAFVLCPQCRRELASRINRRKRLMQ